MNKPLAYSRPTDYARSASAIKASASRRTSRLVLPGFTLMELIVAVAIIALLIAIVIGVLGTVRERANEVKCATNLRTLGSAVLLYSQVNQNRFPAREGSGSSAIRHLAKEQLEPYLGLPEEDSESRLLGLWRCPSSPAEWMFSYGTNPNFWNTRLSTLNDPASFVLLRDRGGASWPGEAGGVDNTTIGSAWHNGRYNVVYADGGVASVTREVLLDQLVNSVPTAD